MTAEPSYKSAPFQRLATSAVPISDRLDFWQDLFSTCNVSRPTVDPGKDFRSELLRFAQDDGTAFVGIKGDPLVCQFGRRESGMVLIGHVRAGTVQINHDNGERTIIDNASGLVMFDCDRPLVTTSTDYELAELVMPRSLLTGVLGSRRVPRDKSVVFLPNDGLAPILRSHLDAIAANGASLNRREAAAVMQAATSLTVALLSRCSHAFQENRAFDEHLFVATIRYIEAHASRHDLTATAIAMAVGCSRAHLYRLFANRSLHVAGVLRDVRLTRARRLIESNGRRSIGSIAFECGYSDLSAFGKAFRRQFGMSPGECRAQSGAAS